MREQHQAQPDSGRSNRSVALPIVPGVVDGLITTLTDADGCVSLQIRIKMRHAAVEDGEHIEVVLDPEHCAALGNALLATGSAAPTVRPHLPAIPCSVGVSLQHSFDRREPYGRAKEPA
ncbi:hypothetical protein AB0G85_34855 [Streptomyces sioyaensis]|uniref:hypothetical protein n=1 Tax=Streptomyces sioyaensis TaxID=67364 RepID=UPI0033D12221